jgi:hypothetical protein
MRHVVAGGAALFALTKRETTESPRALPKPLTFFHLTGPQTG